MHLICVTDKLKVPFALCVVSICQARHCHLQNVRFARLYKSLGVCRCCRTCDDSFCRITAVCADPDPALRPGRRTTVSRCPVEATKAC